MADVPDENRQTTFPRTSECETAIGQPVARLAWSCFGSILIHVALLLSVALDSNSAISVKPIAKSQFLGSFRKATQAESPLRNEVPLPTAPHSTDSAARYPAQRQPSAGTSGLASPPPDATSTEERPDDGGLIEMPGPLYLDSRELTAKPELLGDVILALPSDMSATWHGRLVLELLINSGGTVDEIIPQSTDVPLDAVNMTVKSFWKNIYAPGRLNGEAVNSKIWVEVIFGSQSEAPTTPRTPSLVQ